VSHRLQHISLGIRNLKLTIPTIHRPKLKFNPNVVSDGLFAPDQIMTDGWGGTVNFEYKHEEYWAALTKMCNDRRAQEKARWLELGGRVGLREWDIKSPSTSSFQD
jgi:hypothetical protein